MAITRTATPTSFSTTTAAVTDWSFTHNCAANTTILILAVLCEAHCSVSGTPTWNTTENFSIIHASTSSNTDGDMRAYIYGLVNPTPGNLTIGLTVTGTAIDNGFACAVSYLGTISSSVADATNFIAEDVNNTATVDVVMNAGSAGTAGATAFAVADLNGGDGDPASETASGGQFAEIFDTATGGSTTADTSVWVGDAINWTPAPVTIDWLSTVSDESAGILIEILPDAGGGVTVAPGVGTVALTGVVPTVSASLAPAPGVAAVAVSGHVPTVSTATNVTAQPSVGVAAVTGVAPSVASSALIAPALGTVAATGRVPVIAASSQLTPAVSTIGLTGQAPDASAGINVSVQPGVGTVALLGVAPVLSLSALVEVNAGAVALTGSVPAITVGSALTVAPGAIAITGYVPGVSVVQIPPASWAVVPVGSLRRLHAVRGRQQVTTAA